MARVRVSQQKKAEAAAVDQEVEDIFSGGKGGGKPGANPLPFTIQPALRKGFDRVVETVIDEEIDVVAEYEALEKHLTIEDALTPQAVRSAVNECEKYAKRAHRLFVVAKVELERYRLDADVALGAMRDQASASLQREKDAGKRSKAITDADVRDRASILYPDEWREITERLVAAESMLKHLERLSEIWYRRCYSLGNLSGSGTGSLA